MSVTARLRHVLAGNYRIDAFLGAGGVGQVYAATQLETGERVAVKFLRSELAGETELKRRFIYEARAVSQLEHPNAVRVRHQGEDPDHGLYMVLELLHGETLEARLQCVQKLSVAQTCEWLLPILDMLEHAHARGLLHRDIKPANIFLHEAAPGCIVPKLLDFGLVRDMTATLGLNTRTGQAIGTPPHMSPEQARGQKGLTAASDVWSMAVVIYRCVTGVEPFGRASASGTIVAVVNGEYTPIRERCPELPEAIALGELLDAALRVDPTQRMQTMAQLRAALRALIEGPAPSLRAGTGTGLTGTNWPERGRESEQRCSPAPRARTAGVDPARALLGAGAVCLGAIAVWWLVEPTPSQTSHALERAVQVETRVYALQGTSAPDAAGRAAPDAAVAEPVAKPQSAPKALLP